MDWPEAREWIRQRTRVGTDVNSPRSTRRVVEALGPLAAGDRYGYRAETGFLVRIGESNSIRIPWTMLETCFSALQTGPGYDGAFFRKHFPVQARDHPCHVHVVGQIFPRSGLTMLRGNVYVRAF